LTGLVLSNLRECSGDILMRRMCGRCGVMINSFPGVNVIGILRMLREGGERDEE
jgi:hypothetical protein